MNKHKPMDAEKPWETVLSGILFVACLVVLWALLLMIYPPDERVVYEDEKVTIVERASK